MKIDPYKRRESYEKWKDSIKDGIPGLNKCDSVIILQYLNDMEKGVNVSSKCAKGPRGHGRLISLKNRLIFFSRKFMGLYHKSLTDMTEEQLTTFFSDMKSGVIKKMDGANYQSVDTYAKIFKAFWHWWEKYNKKRNVQVPDITIDLDTKQEKPKWVYLTEDQVRKLCNQAKYEYKVLIMFLYDAGIRAPGELMNVKVSDLYNDCKELNIREEIVKKGSFGRRIKLMLCAGLLKEYINEKKLGQDDYLFQLNPFVTNRYLKRLAVRVLGNGLSEAGKRYSEIRMYDFRHNSCCYWLLRYKSESALKYRFGWRKSDKIHYYSELLGMKDTISEEDLLIDITKTEIENKLLQSEKERLLLLDKVNTLERQMNKIIDLTNVLHEKVKQ